MRPSKWLVFIRPSLAGFDRPLTATVRRQTIGEQTGSRAMIAELLKVSFTFLVAMLSVVRFAEVS